MKNNKIFFKAFLSLLSIQAFGQVGGTCNCTQGSEILECRIGNIQSFKDCPSYPLLNLKVLINGDNKYLKVSPLISFVITKSDLNVPNFTGLKDIFLAYDCFKTKCFISTTTEVESEGQQATSSNLYYDKQRGEIIYTSDQVISSIQISNTVGTIVKSLSPPFAKENNNYSIPFISAAGTYLISINNQFSGKIILQ
jgi:hypothetical protein